MVSHQFAWNLPTIPFNGKMVQKNPTPPNARFHVDWCEGGGLILPLILGKLFEYQGLILTHVRLVGSPQPSWGFQFRGLGHGVLTELFTNTYCGFPSFVAQDEAAVSRGAVSWKGLLVTSLTS